MQIQPALLTADFPVYLHISLHGRMRVSLSPVVTINIVRAKSLLLHGSSGRRHTGGNLPFPAPEFLQAHPADQHRIEGCRLRIRVVHVMNHGAGNLLLSAGRRQNPAEIGMIRSVNQHPRILPPFHILQVLTGEPDLISPKGERQQVLPFVIQPAAGGPDL